MRLSLLLPVALTLLPATLLAQSKDSARLPAALARSIDRAVSEERERQQVVGLAIGVIRGGEIAYLEGYGLADRERKRPVTTRSLFRWASISKPVTAVAAMQLWDQGKLDLDRDVRGLVPEFPDKAPAVVTTRQLLGHLGGIVHYRNGKVIRTRREYERPHPFADVILALDRFKESPLVAPPGERFSYTTHGYILLSAVVQRAGGAPFATQVRKRIAEPLGMKSLRPDYQWEKIPERVVGYRRLAGVIVPSANTDVSWKLGGGGFISNIEDLALFARALIRGRLVSQKATRLMWTRQKTRAGKRTGYGLGFGVSGKGRDRRIAHNGAQEKTRTRMVFYPERGLGVVVMCNSEFAQPGKFSKRVLELLERDRVRGPY